MVQLELMLPLVLVLTSLMIRVYSFQVRYNNKNTEEDTFQGMTCLFLLGTVLTKCVFRMINCCYFSLSSQTYVSIPLRYGTTNATCTDNGFVKYAWCLLLLGTVQLIILMNAHYGGKFGNEGVYSSQVRYNKWQLRIGILAVIMCLLLLGMVQLFGSTCILGIFSILFLCLFLLGMVQNRYEKIRKREVQCVSIPLRYGTKTDFSAFSKFILPHSVYFARFFAKKVGRPQNIKIPVTLDFTAFLTFGNYRQFVDRLFEVFLPLFRPFED